MGRLRHIVIQYLVKKLLKAITVEEILQYTDQQWIVENRSLSRDELMMLQEDADRLLSSSLWKYMQKELTWLANQRMFDQSKNNDDIVFGKAMLYNQFLQSQFLKRMKNLL